MEKDDHYLRGQPQESGRLGQRLRGRPGRAPALARSAWPTAFCPRTGAATSTGLTPRWALNWASLPEGAYTGARVSRAPRAPRAPRALLGRPRLRSVRQSGHLGHLEHLRHLGLGGPGSGR